ncbi:Hypothetical_protein [Hexamita inflata]|uniref:Hypothetical_protein n=1 Tax=Hexamita inflata TaxID=28002 RepID=A0AA86S501_9EUKA|nr:Hypothetical protein HINF_LOCUS65785 [Hexamita inflata]
MGPVNCSFIGCKYFWVVFSHGLPHWSSLSSEFEILLSGFDNKLPENCQKLNEELKEMKTKLQCEPGRFLNPTSWCDVGKTRRGKWDYPSLVPLNTSELRTKTVEPLPDRQHTEEELGESQSSQRGEMYFE